jgi:hypothetical protein
VSCLEEVTDFEIIAPMFVANQPVEIITSGKGLIITAKDVLIFPYHDVEIYL